MTHASHASQGLIPIKLNLTKAQVKKAHSGKKIRVLHHNIGVGNVIHVHPTTHERLVKAYQQQRGTTIHVTPGELAGAGFLDTLKDIASKVASPVISGLAGVAGEIFPDHKNTINKVREGIRSATGYGIKKKPVKKNVKFLPGNVVGKGIANLRGPTHFPAQYESYGSGINPSGFY